MRIIYFGNPSSTISNLMLGELVEALKHRGNISLVAVIDTSRHSIAQRLLRQDLWSSLFRYTVIKAFNLFQWVSFDYHRIPANVMRAKDINDSVFISKLKELKPDVAFSVGCPQRFHGELLDIFDYCVNYHDSLLPKYRGISSTAFSVYYNEVDTGYTFHLMKEEFDSGNILVKGNIPVGKSTDSRKSMYQLTIDKTLEASKHLGEVFDCLLGGDSGYPQDGEASYFGFEEWHRLLTITNLNSLPFTEIRHRIIICGYLIVNFNGRDVYVTDIKNKKGRVEINRIYYLPVWLWRFCEWLGVSKGLEISK